MSALDAHYQIDLGNVWFERMETSPASERARWARLNWNEAQADRARFLASGRGPGSPLSPYELQMQKVALTAAGGPDVRDPILDPRRVVTECLDRWPPAAEVCAVLTSGDRAGKAWDTLRWTYRGSRWLFRWHEAGWLAPVADPRLPGLLALRPALEAAFARDPVLVSDDWG